MRDKTEKMDAAVVAGAEGGRRPSVVPATTAAPDDYDGDEAADFGRDGRRGLGGRHRGDPASGRLVLVGSVGLAPATRQRGSWWPAADQARPQACRAQPFGGGTCASQTGECTAGEEAAARRSDHRYPKKSCSAAGNPAGNVRQRRRVMMDTLVSLAPSAGLTAGACAALSLSRASVYRQRADLARPATVRRPRPSPRRSLCVLERQAVVDLLRAPRFADQAPAEIYASLLDEGTYHCSIRTMYRILAASQEVRERRDQLRHPVYQKPELLAQSPNEVWSWDITKLMGPAKWTYFYLYVIIDIFSRRVVGWCVADRESATLFTALFNDAVAKH